MTAALTAVAVDAVAVDARAGPSLSALGPMLAPFLVSVCDMSARLECQ